MDRRFRAIYYGWWIVAIALAVNTLETGIYFLGFSVFFLPISRDLQISRTLASLPFSLAKLVSAVASPFMGLTVDRVGPGKVLFLGGFVAGLGYFLLNFSSTYLLFLLAYVLLITPAIQGGLNLPTTAAINQWFIRKRALALGIASMGFALGGAIITPLVAVAVQKLGWHTAALLIGILIWVTVLPLSLLLRRSPEENGLNPDGSQDLESTPEGAAPNPQLVRRVATTYDFSLKEALKTPTYWFLTISYGMRGMFGGAISIHLVAMMVWKGIDESTAGLLVGTYPFLWIPASVAMGWLADRHSKQRVAAVGGLISALGMLLWVMWGSMSVWQMLLVFLLLSPNEGTWPLAWAMLGDQFGRKHYGLLRGSVMTGLSLMGVVAPIYSGWVFDTTQSYAWVIVPSALLLALAGLLNWFMPPARPGGQPQLPPQPVEAIAGT